MRGPNDHQIRRVNKSVLQSIWDFVGIPFRLVLFDQAWLPRFGWTTLQEERLNIVLPYLRGELLDIGAGLNMLVRRYGSGVGVDVYDWGGDALIVKDTSLLPFPDQTFDTITFLACLNHIPNRKAVIREVRRVIRPDGQLIITMIGPFLGAVGHSVWWYSEDKRRGGMKVGEVGGISKHEIVQMCGDEGFCLQLHRRFTYGMNNMYLFKVADESLNGSE